MSLAGLEPAACRLEADRSGPTELQAQQAEPARLELAPFRLTTERATFAPRLPTVETSRWRYSNPLARD
jgi:hypothetical protein